ncbi:hypothetical protein GIW70_20945 [Pseudomonas syringae]|nr:hypothetical protein [Pseudomonas syringae]MCF5070654.1 hypothetical protein [Pseudomonas syringae]
MVQASAWRMYAGLLLLLVLQLCVAESEWSLRNVVILIAACTQFVLVLVFWLGLVRHRGWVRVFGWLYLCWLGIMALFILGEQLTR